jgi:hypothetical protein
MNERIRELESQCWEARQYGPPWFNSKKFAELIVKECAEMVNQDGDTVMAQGILHRFGVE